MIALGAFVLALPNDEPTRESAPTTTRDKVTCAEREGLPEGVSCARVAKDYELAVAVHYVEQVSFARFAEAAWAEYEAELAAQQSRSTGYGGGSGVGECTGFVIPDYIIERESGGSSTAHNPSGAHGCTQTLLSHYDSGGACAGLDPNSIQGQRDCTYILSDGGSNLDPWAATL